MPESLSLAAFGSYHVGGRLVAVSGKPVQDLQFKADNPPVRVDPNGLHQVEQVYVQYFVPAERRGTRQLLLWHGGGLTGVCWETTPDGREGWLHWFLRRGWTVHVSDAVERGRAGWAMNEILGGEPVFLPAGNAWERFRIGDGPGSWNDDPSLRRQRPGNLFPAEAYGQFLKQGVPRWLTTDEATVEGYVALLDHVGPSVLVVHSQAGPFALAAARERPQLVSAIVLLEPSGVAVSMASERLITVPMLFVYGDYIAEDARWRVIHANALGFVEQLRVMGGTVDLVDLPERGVKGNSHMLMMDRNSDEVAGVVQAWLTAKGFWR
jgi:hypothetical protein